MAIFYWSDTSTSTRSPRLAEYIASFCQRVPLCSVDHTTGHSSPTSWPPPDSSYMILALHLFKKIPNTPVFVLYLSNAHSGAIFLWWWKAQVRLTAKCGTISPLPKVLFILHFAIGSAAFTISRAKEQSASFCGEGINLHTNKGCEEGPIVLHLAVIGGRKSAEKWLDVQCASVSSQFPCSLFPTFACHKLKKGNDQHFTDKKANSVNTDAERTWND